MTKEKLSMTLELHKKWLEHDSGGVRADLQSADLQSADLRGANLHSADLHSADLHSADLRGANLRGANLFRADLHGADLRCADLRCADLHSADLRGANLFRADLRGADLRGANLHGADLRGANLCRADLRGANLHGADLCRADLDFSCLPLWRGSLDMRVDRRIAAQIAYHFCSLVCDDPEVKALQESLHKFANEFHHIGKDVPKLQEAPISADKADSCKMNSTTDVQDDFKERRKKLMRDLLTYAEQIVSGEKNSPAEIAVLPEIVDRLIKYG